MKQTALQFLPGAVVIVCLCWVVDCTAYALDFETWTLAPKTSAALCAVLRGFALPDEVLRCTVTAACSGLRTIIACGALAVLLRKWRLIPLALAGGFLLNLARVVIVELLCRVDVPFGMMVHDLALFLVVLPIGLFAVTLYRQLSHAGRCLIQAYTLMLSGALLSL